MAGPKALAGFMQVPDTPPLMERTDVTCLCCLHITCLIKHYSTPYNPVWDTDIVIKIRAKHLLYAITSHSLSSPSQDVEDDCAAHQERHHGASGLGVDGPQQQHQGDQAGHGHLPKQSAPYWVVWMQHGKRGPFSPGEFLCRGHRLLASSQTHFRKDRPRWSIWFNGANVRQVNLCHSGSEHPSQQLRHKVREHHIHLQASTQVDGQGEGRVEMGSAADVLGKVMNFYSAF